MYQNLSTAQIFSEISTQKNFVIIHSTPKNSWKNFLTQRDPKNFQKKK
jgi:hypothetical protein